MSEKVMVMTKKEDTVPQTVVGMLSKEDHVSQSSTSRMRDFCHRSVGLFLALLSAVFLTTYSALMKELKEMDPMQVVVVRGLVQMLVMGSVAFFKQLSFRGTSDRKTGFLIALNSVFGGLRLICMFVAVTLLPLGDYSTILSASPILVMLLSVFVLRETCGVFRVLASANLLAGVVLVSQPPIIFPEVEEETYNIFGYSLAIMASAMSAGGIIVTKLCVKKEVEKVILLFYMGLSTTLCGTIGLLSLGTPSIPGYGDWLLALAVAGLGVLQQFCYMWAIQLESSPARVSVARQVQIILSFTVQVLVFKMVPDWMDLLGAGLVLLTVVVIPFERNIVDQCWGQKEEEEEWVVR